MTTVTIKILISLIVPNIFFWTLCAIVMLASIKKIDQGAQEKNLNSFITPNKYWLIISVISLLFAMPIVPQSVHEFLFPKSMHNLISERLSDSYIDRGASVIVFTGGKSRLKNLGWVPDPRTLERAVIGASFAKQNNLPLVIVGGNPGIESPAAASLIAEALNFSEAEILTGAKNTKESAAAVEDHFASHRKRSAPIIIVTHASHIRRVSLHLKSVGMNPVAYIPVGFEDSITLASWLPSTTTFLLWRDIVYECAALIRMLL